MCDAFGRTPLNKNLSFVYCITFLRFVKGIFLCVSMTCYIFVITAKNVAVFVRDSGE